MATDTRPSVSSSPTIPSRSPGRPQWNWVCPDSELARYVRTSGLEDAEGVVSKIFDIAVRGESAEHQGVLACRQDSSGDLDLQQGRAGIARLRVQTILAPHLMAFGRVYQRSISVMGGVRRPSGDV